MVEVVEEVEVMEEVTLVEIVVDMVVDLALDLAALDQETEVDSEEGKSHDNDFYYCMFLIH